MNTLDLLVILACLVLAAFFAGIETGIISIHRVRLRHRVKSGSRSARILQDFLDHPDRLLGTVLVGVNCCLVVGSVFAARIGMRLHPHWGVPISSVIMTLLFLIFSEYLPKAWFQSRPLERSLPFARLLKLFSHLLRPIILLINGVTNWLIPRAPAQARARQPFLSREDLKQLTRDLAQHGELPAAERKMIHRVFELASRTAGQIMIPRAQMGVLSSAATVGELLEAARRTGFRRFPLWSDERKAFAGIVNVADVLSAGEPNPADRAADFMRVPQFIPDYMPVDEILPRMRHGRQAVCLVTNIQSQVVGLLTTEDVLEEIVGNL